MIHYILIICRGFTPFHWALKSGNRYMINLLLPYVRDDILTSESELDDEERYVYNMLHINVHQKHD